MTAFARKIHDFLHPQQRQRTVDILPRVHQLRDRAEVKRQRTREVQNISRETELRQCVRELLAEIELLRGDAVAHDGMNGAELAAWCVTTRGNVELNYQGVI